MVTANTITELLESNVKQFTLKDGSIMHFCSLFGLPQHPLNWVIDNPGRQLFTGSFHPVEDKLWEDRRSWDRRVEPKESVSLLDIFEKRVITRVAFLRQNAFAILANLSPFIGNDLINFILERLDWGDLARMNCLCKMNKNNIQRAEPTVTKLTPVCSPSSSLILGNSSLFSLYSIADYSIFKYAGVQKDLFSYNLAEIMNKSAPGFSKYFFSYVC